MDKMEQNKKPCEELKIFVPKIRWKMNLKKNFLYDF